MQRRRAQRAGQYQSPEYLALQAVLAANLRRLREARGWTQEVAAEQAQMTFQLYQRLESARTNWTCTTLARLVRAFGVRASKLLAPAPTRMRDAARVGGAPITQLIEAVELHGRAPPAWVVRWSRGGADPLRRAWAANRAGSSAMLRVLLVARDRAGWQRAGAAVRAVAPHPLADYDRRCCAAIRHAVPEPPTLAVLCAALE